MCAPPRTTAGSAVCSAPRITLRWLRFDLDSPLSPEMASAASRKHSWCHRAQGQEAASQQSFLTGREGGVGTDLALMKSLADPDKVQLPLY